RDAHARGENQDGTAQTDCLPERAKSDGGKQFSDSDSGGDDGDAAGSALRRNCSTRERHENPLGGRVIETQYGQATDQHRRARVLNVAQREIHDYSTIYPPMNTAVRLVRSASRPAGIPNSMYAPPVIT